MAELRSVFIVLANNGYGPQHRLATQTVSSSGNGETLKIVRWRGCSRKNLLKSFNLLPSGHFYSWRIMLEWSTSLHVDRNSSYHEVIVFWYIDIWLTPILWKNIFSIITIIIINTFIIILIISYEQLVVSYEQAKSSA